MNMAARLAAIKAGQDAGDEAWSPPQVAGTCGRNRDGSPIHVYEDGSDDYCGEDDLTERAVENANDLWASMDDPRGF